MEVSEQVGMTAEIIQKVRFTHLCVLVSFACDFIYSTSFKVKVVFVAYIPVCVCVCVCVGGYLCLIVKKRKHVFFPPMCLAARQGHRADNREKEGKGNMSRGQ